MFDKEKLAYDLSLSYAQEILKNRPEDVDCIGEMNELLLGAFQNAYNFYSEKFGLSSK